MRDAIARHFGLGSGDWAVLILLGAIAFAALLNRTSAAASEGNDGSDCRLHEGVGERAREQVNGFPAGAVRW